MKITFTKYYLLILMAFSLSACQMNSDDAQNDETGELTIELTDAKGDFSNYSVDVLSLSLTKQNGSIVEVLPETTRIDFSQYVEMSELLTLAVIPKGIYTAATLNLDYQNAEIYVEDDSGISVKVDSIADENGDVLTSISTKINLAERNQLHIVPGVPAHLSLDFDLKTSNVVSFDETDIPSIIVSPSLNASLEPELDKTHRLRGPLKSVNVENANFKLIIRPFNKKMNGNDERFGKLQVSTNDTTQIDINGESSTGTEGITALAALDKLSAVIVIGEISLNPRQFMATEVYAGSSVPGGTMDVVRGTVLSRVDNTLTVRGATLIRAGGSVLFNDDVNINIASETIVKRQGDNIAVTIDDVSVGQAITAFGVLNDDTANLSLDATTGSVRMRITNIRGSIIESTEIPEGDAPFELSLTKISGRNIELFNFSGTGIDAENDADPRFYEIETGALDTGKFEEKTTVNVRGFVNGFGQAPTDFIAKSIVGMKTIKAAMQTNWRPPSNTAFSNISPGGIVLDFIGSGRFHHIGRGHERLDLTKLSSDFTLMPDANEEGVYILLLTDSKHVHTTFENFANDLQDQINVGALVKKIQAKGIFDVNTGIFSAKAIRVHLQ